MIVCGNDFYKLSAAALAVARMEEVLAAAS